ncbi:MAG: hypothetical protein ABR867_03335 [Nitrososphaerales archaeon]
MSREWATGRETTADAALDYPQKRQDNENDARNEHELGDEADQERLTLQFALRPS